MWDELARELGDDEFFEIARSWLTGAGQPVGDPPAALRPLGERQGGLELTAFFDAWITGSTHAARGAARRLSGGHPGGP